METDEGLPFAANYPEAARPLSASHGLNCQRADDNQDV